MQDIRFSMLLDNLMTFSLMNSTQLEAKLREIGINTINRKRISEYRRGTSTPCLEKAYFLMQALGADISKQSLETSLALNREYVRETRAEDEVILNNKTVFVEIRLRRLAKDKSVIECERYINSRIESNGYGNITEYIEALISEDIKKAILEGDN